MPRKNSNVGSRKPRRSGNKTRDYTTEVSLWLVAAGFPMPETEIIFHQPKPGEKRRMWRLDLGYPEYKIAIELHGVVADHRPCKVCKQPKLGRHHRKEGFQEDRVKMNTAHLQGWIVIECAMPDHWTEQHLLTWLCDAADLRGMPYTLRGSSLRRQYTPNTETQDDDRSDQQDE